ncbi:MAG: pyridoxal 5'-phosphate synthase glutaminase subunit PdxT [Chloroflexi bacterium]|nr:pyridoxal 5'-phosphate synthase glutaminase subunit PdxT [Chloroflexota bacterium]
MKIGIMGLQGSVIEHVNAVAKSGAEPVIVKYPKDMDGISGLIIPGGESTAIQKLMEKTGLAAAIKEKADSGLSLYGTCAGLIMMAKEIDNGTDDQLSLGLIDIKAKRNAYGRQNESFEEYIDIPALGDRPFPGVFIRAPLIIYSGEGVEILGRYGDGIAAARQGKFLVSAFHPELTDDMRFHRYFISMCDG